MPFRVHFDSNDEHGLPRHKAENILVYGPDGHQLALQGPATVMRWGPQAGAVRFASFGRTFGYASEHRTHSGNILWDEATITDKGTRRIVVYALNKRGWQVAECTVDHPLRDILPDGWGRP